jgi:hypothetical protein
MYGVLDLTWKPSPSQPTPPEGKAPCLIRNDPYDHTIRVTGGWADLGGEEFVAQARLARLTGATAGDATVDFEVTKEQDALDLLIHFHVDQAVTTALPTALSAGGFWDCQIVDGHTILAGKAKLLDDVTRAA